MGEESAQMDPNVWGPPLWDMLFTIAFHCPQCSSELQDLFVLLEKVIPCRECRKSYATYRRQVKTTTVIRADTPNSAAMWLWTIHDMVNQKIGKICISFNKLEKRHRTMTVLTHDLSIFDLFCIIAIGAKASARQHVVDFIRLVARLLQDVPPFRLPQLLAGCPVSAERLFDDLFHVHMRLADAYGMIPNNRLDFDKQYAHAHA